MVYWIKISQDNGNLQCFSNTDEIHSTSNNVCFVSASPFEIAMNSIWRWENVLWLRESPQMPVLSQRLRMCAKSRCGVTIWRNGCCMQRLLHLGHIVDVLVCLPRFLSQCYLISSFLQQACGLHGSPCLVSWQGRQPSVPTSFIEAYLKSGRVLISLVSEFQEQSQPSVSRWVLSLGVFIVERTKARRGVWLGLLFKPFCLLVVDMEDQCMCICTNWSLSDYFGF